ELQLSCSVKTLKRRCKEAGYYSCICCQKPYLTKTQANARWLWGIAHMFWTIWEWSQILYSDEVTFQVGGKKCKQRCIRNKKERCYGYKSPLINIHGTGKSGAFTQTDYLAQVLKPYIQDFLAAFAAVLGPGKTPQFMEDGNSAHGHKTTSNICATWRTSMGITLFPHPAVSPDMNPIEKCWRRIKQALHRRLRQPTTKVQIVVVVLEE
ncbi:uncharacterized protein LY89DRAFT_765471, partial [Mollisia scopiformis]